MPPEGKELASGSPTISELPENFSMATPSPLTERNASCFSAVDPVSGWNQWQKCVAPFSSAQSFIAPATVLATIGFSGWPCMIVPARLIATSGGSRLSMMSPLKVNRPK